MDHPIIKVMSENITNVGCKYIRNRNIKQLGKIISVAISSTDASFLYKNGVLFHTKILQYNKKINKINVYITTKKSNIPFEANLV